MIQFISEFEDSPVQAFYTMKPYIFRPPSYLWEEKEFSEESLSALAREIGMKRENIMVLNQIHSNTCVHITRENSLEVHEADASYTSLDDIVLIVLVSDCVPVLLYDTEKHIVAAIHAGRVWLEKNIIEATLSELEWEHKSERRNIHVYIGPAISQEFYELWKQEIEFFLQQYPENVHIKDNKYFLDIRWVTKKQLNGVGVIYESESCTYKEKESFHSYRRRTHGDTQMYGNNAVGIYMNSLAK